MLTADALSAILGGRRALKVDIKSETDLRRGVEAGLPYAAVAAVMKRFGFSRADVAAALRVPMRTLARRRLARRLNLEESERLVRLARLAGEASRILGTDQKAAHWLRDPNYALGGDIPIELVATDIGAGQVDEILAHIEYGMVS